ncbi:MAG: hypothetical protein AAF767_09565 [Pseudomonadota bacterium]
MNDQVSDTNGGLKDEDVVALARRSTDAYNEVILQADYTTRAALSFYRFRQLGGDYRLKSDKGADRKKRQKRDETPPTSSADGAVHSKASQDSGSKTYRKLRLGESTGRGVHYVSSHPKVPLLQMSIVALMVLFESAANAYFFAKQSEFGIAGGVFQAAAVSLANVAVSFFVIGYWGLRHTSMPLDRENIFGRRNLYFANGVLAIVFGTILVLLVNLSAAHYRNILDILALGKEVPDNISSQIIPHFPIDKAVCDAILGSELGNTIGSAATNAMCRPFALHSLDAMVLLALGLAIAAIAAFEGRRLDSPFPGFSDSARSLESARVDLRDALFDFEDSYEDIKDLILEVKFGPENMDDHDLTPREKMLIHQTMQEMMAPYQKLLRTTDDALSDEFGLEHDIVDQFRVKARDAG